MIVRTPRPSSPSRCATVPSNSSSDDALDRLPSLSLRRTTSSRLRVPSGSTRGTTKQVTPPVGLRQHQEDVVHRRRGEPLVAVQRVLAVDRRRPRLGDVGADVGAALLLGHPHAGERAELGRGAAAGPGRRTCDASSGVHSFASASSARSAGTAAYVIEIGQPWPGSVCDQAMKPGGPAHVGVRRRPTPTAPRPARGRPRAPSASATTGGTRPRRSGCRSGRTASARGWCSLASIPCSRASAVPASGADRRRGRRPPPPTACRVTASTRAGSAVTML